MEYLGRTGFEVSQAFYNVGAGCAFAEPGRERFVYVVGEY